MPPKDINPYEAPHSDGRIEPPKRRPPSYARPQFRIFAAVVGVWLVWTSTNNAIRFWPTEYWRLSIGTLGGFTSAAYLLWIAIRGRLALGKRSG